MSLSRRAWLQLFASGLAASALHGDTTKTAAPLRITGLSVTPIALPDPPLLTSSGLHGPYFLRNIVEVKTDAGIVGVGETKGGVRVTEALEKATKLVAGKNVFGWRTFQKELMALSSAAYAGVELACLDACGKATGRGLCELLGGPLHDEVEFAAYLFYRHAADHPTLLADRRIVDHRGKALDDWGEVRTAEAMVRMAERFRKQWGFRVFKLKAGILPVAVEIETMERMNAHFGGKCPLRIDPNANWTVPTALRAATKLKAINLEYYEDPVRGHEAMAQVRQETGLAMSTNMVVTRFEHVREALKHGSIDVLLCDHHNFAGIPACQELGRLCEAVGWKMSQHSNNHGGVTMAAMIAVGAVCPQLTLASDTHYPWLPAGRDIIEGPNLAIRGGKMKVPSGPGVGVKLDRDKLAKAHEVYRKCGMRERNDVETMRLLTPGWEKKPF